MANYFNTLPLREQPRHRRVLAVGAHRVGVGDEKRQPARPPRLVVASAKSRHRRCGLSLGSFSPAAS